MGQVCLGGRDDDVHDTMASMVSGRHPFLAYPNTRTVPSERVPKQMEMVTVDGNSLAWRVVQLSGKIAG